MFRAQWDWSETAGLKARCQFMASSVSYLGYRIDTDRLHPLDNTMQAVVNAPCPNVHEVRRTLTFWHTKASFNQICKLSWLLLYQLFCKDTQWCRRKQQDSWQLSAWLLITKDFVCSVFCSSLLWLPIVSSISLLYHITPLQTALRKGQCKW